MLNKDLFVFSSSPDYSDSPRALSDYISAQTDYECFWIIRDNDLYEILSSQGVACALEGSNEAVKKISSAQYLVSDSFDFAFNKRKDQIHISTWHGFGPKRIGFFESAARSQESFESLKVITTQCDLFVASSPAAQLCHCGSFAMDLRKVEILGYPRNDYIFSESGKDNLRKIIKNDLDLDEVKLVLYLPTMRKGLKDEGIQFDQNLFNYSDYDAREIDRFLEQNNAYIVTKLHFADNDLFEIDKSMLPKRMIFLSTKELVEQQLTVYHLLNAFDVLVTDYSSIYSDFMLLDKPIVFSWPDFGKFQVDRGFIVDDPRFMMPGGFVESQKQLLEELSRCLDGQDAYKEYRHFMMSYFHTYCDGDSSKRLFNAVMHINKSLPDCNKDYANLYVCKDSKLSQYTGKCTGEFYFDFGDGFSNDNMQIIKYDLHSFNECGFIYLDSNIPSKDLQAIRFDPDCTDRVIIEEFVFIVNGYEFAPTYTNGIEADKKVFFQGNDPQVVLDLSKCGFFGDVESVSVRFKPLDAIYEGSSLLAKAQIEKLRLQRELNGVYHSKSWKITKPLRSIRELLS